ncbi:hypothetical protein DSF71_05685 [Salmonella enterica subsp. enterica serovar Hvittingfoss]|uniref:Uncharacterized protein n=1 Tax=Salmonella enterica TaxID=28901 RepID=A0A403T4U5_SALER|nr:hypothetical protein [Salmonella enterica]EBK4665436.1 hypothetical protein [Salmonella enterica]EBS2924911.1 hypothetical protein [Salmonella enterica subsp. enterica serovar Hvittingfoss]EBX7469079.1 hypothetical protein [Salmonella enterica subsp. enterica serovar Bareilly]MMS78849.1 hypothetical protein [Salmonella enterica]
MMKNFPLIHTVRTAYSVDGAVLCTIYAHNSRFAGLPWLMFTFAGIPPFFTGVHALIPQLMNMVLLTERSDRDVWRHRSENVLSVNGMVRTAVVGPVPFSPFFAVFYTVQNV